jgi:hypothetical protein
MGGEIQIGGPPGRPGGTPGVRACDKKTYLDRFKFTPLSDGSWVQKTKTGHGLPRNPSPYDVCQDDMGRMLDPRANLRLGSFSRDH